MMAAAHSSLGSCLPLNNKLAIPCFGLGVFKADCAETRDAVKSALEVGYRHIDTAQFYENESDVGEGVRASGLSREEVWITSKIMPTAWSDPATAFDKTLAAIKESVRRIGFDHIDLMLMHAPGTSEGRPEAWRAFEEAQKQGLVRSVGVSNFGPAHLDKLAETATITPAVNQIELHPWLQRREVVQYCRDKGIVVEAYSPLARPYALKESKLDDPQLVNMAERLGKSPAQVLLRWSVQKGFVPLPKSVSRQRQEENAAVFDWQLSDEDMATLDSWEQGLVTVERWDPIKNDPV